MICSLISVLTYTLRYSLIFSFTNCGDLHYVLRGACCSLTINYWFFYVTQRYFIWFSSFNLFLFSRTYIQHIHEEDPELLIALSKLLLLFCLNLLLFRVKACSQQIHLKTLKEAKVVKKGGSWIDATLLVSTIITNLSHSFGLMFVYCIYYITLFSFFYALP